MHKLEKWVKFNSRFILNLLRTTGARKKVVRLYGKACWYSPSRFSMRIINAQ